MLIYSHSTPEKLAPIAYNKEFIQDNTDLCGLVDDPDIGEDVEMAIQYKAALTGDPTAIRTFITNLLLSGYALDASTLDWYITRVKNNPVLFPYVGPITRDAFNFDYRDCLNSPCNYFAPVSPNIGSIGDIGASLNYSTIPSLTSLGNAIPAAFSMAKASLNKIPLSIQKSVGEITQLTTDIFKNTMEIFNDDEEKKKEQEDAIRNGASYRSTSVADIWTSDYRNYFDVSTAASDLLGGIASNMGNCFKLFQYQHRYNPFDYSMNQQAANKSGIQHKVGDIWTAMGYNGMNLQHQGNYRTATNSYTMDPVPLPGQDQNLQSTINGTTVKLYVTVFGGYYNEGEKALYRDASDKYNSAQGYAYFKNTQNGIGHRGNAYIYTPSLEETFIRKWNEGFRYTSQASTPQQGKFNRGFATDQQTITNYFNAVAENVSKSQIRQAIASGTLQAKVKLAGKTFTLPVIDTKGPSDKTVSGTNYRVIDLTADTVVDLYGLTLTTSSEVDGSIDTDIVQTIKNYQTFTGAGSYIADVQFLIPGVYGGSSSTPEVAGKEQATEYYADLLGELEDRSNARPAGVNEALEANPLLPSKGEYTGPADFDLDT
jgi:hypothetical protein